MAKPRGSVKQEGALQSPHGEDVGTRRPPKPQENSQSVGSCCSEVVPVGGRASGVASGSAQVRPAAAGSGCQPNLWLPAVRVADIFSVYLPLCFTENRCLKIDLGTILDLQKKIK